MPENALPTCESPMKANCRDAEAPSSGFQEMVLSPQPEPRRSREYSRLVAELGLAQHMDRPDVLKSELQKLVLSLHPDKSGGAFASEEDKARFMKARRVIGLLNGGESPEDAPADAAPLPGAARALPDASTQAPPPGSARHLQRHSMAEARDRIARQFAAPKIGSAATAAVLLALALLSEQFENNPVLGPLLANPFVVWTLLGLAFTSWWASGGGSGQLKRAWRTSCPRRR
jgi:hypothetical protein